MRSCKDPVANDRFWFSRRENINTDSTSAPIRPNQSGRPKEAAPYGPPASRFVQRIETLINASPKTQRQIAAELGYDKPNIITMFKQGTTRLPIGKVGLLAEVTHGDPVELVRLWLEEYEPDLLVTIETHQRMLLTKEEREWIAGLRQRFPEGLPAWSSVLPQGSAP